MTMTKIPEHESYEIYAYMDGSKPLVFEKYGYYTGDWALAYIKNNKLRLLIGNYGSCSGCDSYEAYTAFEENTYEALQELCKDRAGVTEEYTLDLPTNYAIILKTIIKDSGKYASYSDIDYGDFAKQVSEALKKLKLK